jgi:1-acyl-sn-glycerol-3-phosphate acyltransferase
MNAIARFILVTLFGWKIEGKVTVPKYVLAVIPHTSNWDFPLGLLVRPASNLNHCYYIGKDSLFKFPFGFLFRALGGIPVDRSKNNNFVDNVAEMLQNRPAPFSVCLSPEGTRKPVDKLRTGFYYMAKKGNVPIVLCKFDWGNKTISYAAPYYTTDDFVTDINHVISHFNGTAGKSYVFKMALLEKEPTAEN